MTNDTIAEPLDYKLFVDPGSGLLLFIDYKKLLTTSSWTSSEDMLLVISSRASFCVKRMIIIVKSVYRFLGLAMLRMLVGV